jgi:hypothetical protein
MGNKSNNRLNPSSRTTYGSTFVGCTGGWGAKFKKEVTK